MLLPCLERIDEQWEVLIQYMTKNEKQLGSFRPQRIMMTLKTPATRACVRFVIHVLKLSSSFENIFQQVSYH